MNCPFCNAVNDDQNSFCVSCGQTISQNANTQANVPPPTRFVRPAESDPSPSVDTVYPPPDSFNREIPAFGGQVPPPPRSGGRGGLYIGLALLAFLILAGGGIIGFYVWQKESTETNEVLPDHLGLFIQDKARTDVAEIKKLDVVNALEEKQKLLDNGGLPVWKKDENMILYADGKDIPVTDLKLIPLESIGADGKLKQIDFQAAPIDGKPLMKRLRLPESLADGKYVFALLDGYLDDGKHKFWAFQVTGAGKTENTDIARDATVALKNAPAADSSDKKDKTEQTVKVPPKPLVEKEEPKAAPPNGARVAFCSGNNVVLRGSPGLEGRKIGRLSRGQRLYVLQYSDNYDNWRGTVANWAYIQTESGSRGWVFTPFVSY